ncbi:hypothetical protein HNR55_002936, partial [Acetobacter lovaniensis]|nr:hypothetical protein [Acetobacter lovaniensis]
MVMIFFTPLLIDELFLPDDTHLGDPEP